MQSALRCDHSDEFATKSFIYGASTLKQRIESWWALLRKHSAQFWIERFHELKERDMFNGDYIDKNLIQFVFTNLIQKDLDSLVSLWNSHRIRPIKDQTGPNGRPAMMYMLPHLWNTNDFLQQVPQRSVQIFKDECHVAGPYPCDKLMFDICTAIMVERNFSPPETVEEAFSMYEELKQEIRAAL